MRLIVVFLLGFALASVMSILSSPAAAQYANQHTLTILKENGSPLEILSGQAGLLSLPFTYSKYTDASIARFYWEMHARIRHVAEKPIAVYELRWVLFDAFDERVAEFIGVNNGPFAAIGKGILHAGFPQFINGDEIDAGWKTINTHGGTGVKATVAVRRVRFADGMVWRSGTTE